MRLFELAGDSVEQDLVLLLRNYIQRANAQGVPAELSYEALTNLMKSTGHGAFDYQAFKSIFDVSPELKSVVKNFNSDGVVLNTKVVDDEDGEKVDADDQPTKTVQQMAKRATRKRS